MGIDRYIEHEGFRLNLYVDTKGFATGGIGHKIIDTSFDASWSDEVKKHYWICKFYEDYAKARMQTFNEVKDFKIFPNGKQFELLTELKFNMGDDGFSSKKWPKFFKYMKEGNVDKASYELLHDSKGEKSKWLLDVGSRALKIAKELRTSYESTV